MVQSTSKNGGNVFTLGQLAASAALLGAVGLASPAAKAKSSGGKVSRGTNNGELPSSIDGPGSLIGGRKAKGGAVDIATFAQDVGSSYTIPLSGGGGCKSKGGEAPLGIGSSYDIPLKGGRKSKGRKSKGGDDRIIPVLDVPQALGGSPKVLKGGLDKLLKSMAGGEYKFPDVPKVGGRKAKKGGAFDLATNAASINDTNFGGLPTDAEKADQQFMMYGGMGKHHGGYDIVAGEDGKLELTASGGKSSSSSRSKKHYGGTGNLAATAAGFDTENVDIGGNTGPDGSLQFMMSGGKKASKRKSKSKKHGGAESGDSITVSFA